MLTITASNGKHSENFHYNMQTNSFLCCRSRYKIEMDQKLCWEKSYKQILNIGVNVKPTVMNKQILIFMVYGRILQRILVLQKLWCSNIELFGPWSPTWYPESCFKSVTFLQCTWRDTWTAWKTASTVCLDLNISWLELTTEKMSFVPNLKSCLPLKPGLYLRVTSKDRALPRAVWEMPPSTHYLHPDSFYENRFLWSFLQNLCFIKT